MTQSIIALLGRRDEPTDAVEEYCRYLGGALRTHDIELEIRRVPWELRGWPEALRGLGLQAESWRDRWVLLQYTALAWSARGFPRRIFRALRILRSAGARVAVVFHDVEPYRGTRPIDKLRTMVQIRTMRRAAAGAGLAIFTVPPEKLSWRPKISSRTVFIPVGPNLPIPAQSPARDGPGSVPTIAVFSITGGENGARETRLILAAVQHAAESVGELRLAVFGRHAELRERDLRNGLRGLPVEVSVEGVIDPPQVVARFLASDVLLFVRGSISSRRGSAIAGIACGLPLIAFPGSETAPPITEAGVILVRPGAPSELNEALARVLSDSEYRAELASRSRATYHTYFAWPVIAAQFAALLKV